MNEQLYLTIFVISERLLDRYYTYDTLKNVSYR